MQLVEVIKEYKKLFKEFSVVLLVALFFSVIILPSFNYSPENKKTDFELHFVKKGFIGRVIIIYDPNKGKELTSTVSDTNKLFIPACGNLIIHSNGLSNKKIKVYYFDSTNNTIEKIFTLENDEKVDSMNKNRVAAFSFTQGSFSYNGNKYKNALCYYIDTIKNTFKYSDFELERFGFRECN